MGISDSIGGTYDKAKDALKGNADKVDGTVDKAKDKATGEADKLTGRKYSSTVNDAADKGADMTKDAIGKINKKK
jgi:hypothetical protein